MASSSTEVSIEVGVFCGYGDIAQAVSDAGFVEIDGAWMLDAGTRRERAARVTTSTWMGLAGTSWAGLPCRTVVGKSSKREDLLIELDYCIPDDDYLANAERFESLHRYFFLSEGKE